MRAGLVVGMFVSTGGAVAHQPGADDALVVFSAGRGAKAFTIRCAPKSPDAGALAAWVDRCNALGRTAIDRAVEAGLIAPVEGTAFGMAARFVRDLPASAGGKARSLSRDFPLRGKGR